MLVERTIWEEYREEVSRRIVILPLGSPEQHGPHLPLSVDTVIPTSLAKAGGARIVGERLKDPENRARLRRDWDQHRAEWEDRGGMRDWADILITACLPQPEVQGRNLAEIAEDAGKDPLETAFDLIAISKGQVECVCFGQSEENVRHLMHHPLVVVGSDGDALLPTVCWPGAGLTLDNMTRSHVC